MAALLVAALLVLATYACRSPTEVKLSITTELPCGSLKGVSIVVARDSAAAEERARTGYFAAVTNHCDSASTVGSLVVTPGEPTLAVIVIAGIDRESSTCLPPAYAGCVVARRRLAFIEHTSLDVPITVARDCLDVPCDTDTSCVHGNCRSSETSCEGTACVQTGSSETDDAGGTDAGREGGDGSPADATPDSDASPLIDGGDGGTTYDGGHFVCLASPSCAGGVPPPVPCTCDGPIRLDDGMRMTTLSLSCPAAGPTCGCRVEGVLVKSVPNTGVCRTTDYATCCAQ